MPHYTLQRRSSKRKLELCKLWNVQKVLNHKEIILPSHPARLEPELAPDIPPVSLSTASITLLMQLGRRVLHLWGFCVCVVWVWSLHKNKQTKKLRSQNHLRKIERCVLDSYLPQKPGPTRENSQQPKRAPRNCSTESPSAGPR